MDTGFLKIYRRFFEHDIWKEKRVYSRAEAWIDILRSAEFREEGRKVLVGNKTVKIERGQWSVSVRFLAERWGWSVHRVQNFLAFLRDNKMIKSGTPAGTPKDTLSGTVSDTPTGTGQTIVTVLQYDIYNPPKTGAGTPSGTVSGTPDGTPAGTLTGTKYKNNKRNNNNPPSIPPEGGRARALFVKPTHAEVEQYCSERKSGISASEFINHYEMNGWVVGKYKTPMKDWKAAVRTWEDARRKEAQQKQGFSAAQDYRGTL